MLRLLVEIFKRQDLLQQAYDLSINMLKTELDMFETASNSLRHNVEGEIDVYEKDQQINEYQREVRRKVVAHLATSASRDIVFGLMIVSIIIDIERIGDYIKNMMDLAKDHKHPIDYFIFEEDINKVEANIRDRFSSLIKAFEESDDDLAFSLMKEHQEINPICDNIISSLSKGSNPEIPCGESVSIALYTRYLKRISAHITNAASGIVNTFENLGFRTS